MRMTLRFCRTSRVFAVMETLSKRKAPGASGPTTNPPATTAAVTFELPLRYLTENRELPDMALVVKESILGPSFWMETNVCLTPPPWGIKEVTDWPTPVGL